MARNKELRGAGSHKDPNCGCISCAARRRKEEALARSAGEGGTALAPVSKENEIIYADREVGQGGVPRQTIVKWLNLKAIEPNITQVEAAQRLGIAYSTLRNYIYRANAEGWLRFEDPLARLEHEIVPSAVQNLSIMLKDQDRVATLETLKGTLFRTYQDIHGSKDAPQTILALKIEMSGGESPKFIEGHIVGTPKIVVEEDETPA